MSIFRQTAQARMWGQGQYIKPGADGATANYQLQIQEIKVTESQRSGEGPFLITECKVVETDCPHYKAGDSVSSVINYKHASAISNGKALMLEVMRAVARELGEKVPDIEDYTEDEFASEMEGLCSSDQPAAGMVLYCKAWEVMTRSGNPFTATKWSAAPFDE